MTFSLPMSFRRSWTWSLYSFSVLSFEAGVRMEILAALADRRLVGGAVHNQHRQGDLLEAVVQPLVGAHQGRDGGRRLDLVLGERIILQRLQRHWIAGEVLHVQRQHPELRRDMADAP